MYRPGESMRLEDLKRKGFNPSTILDIGAHSGQFYGWAKNIWPDAFIWMIEANECHANTLSNLTNHNNDKYTIATMGDVEREVNLYTRTDKPHTEGASYYKESSYWDIPQLVMKIPKTLQTLDNLFTDDSSFDLIKMDTQGSEVDIIKGGKNLCKKSKYILLEVSLTKLNEGAPTYEETMSFMEEYGFEQIMSIGEHYNGDELIQKDIIFKNLNK
tara:strand:+ start:3513 stop:4157 length:645 start_codon:yes stop_codon:yes gene_type:complete